MNINYLYLSIKEIPKALSFKQKCLWILSLISKRSHLTYAKNEKVKYGKTSAIKAAHAMEVKYPNHIYDWYLCPHCGYYHIGKRNF